MHPVSIDEWFPLEQQRHYVSMLKGRVGLTRCRSEYFVRLWAYLLLKQQQELSKPLQKPISELSLPEGFVPCTHQEAADLFYGNKERGSDRAAGMMIDKLVALGLIEKQFDGNTICIRIRSLLPNIKDCLNPAEPIQLVPDAFNLRTDAIPVATFLAPSYNWMHKKTTAVPQRIARILRRWATQYPAGMRVLRRCDTHHPVGFYVFYPTARESEENFFLPPSKSFYLSLGTESDPIKIAMPGDKDCTFVFLRSWKIDAPYMQRSHVCQFLKDVQTTLVGMQADFPNLCDFYGIALNPTDEQLASALGFQRTVPDPQLPISWIYIAVDQFLALDMEQAVSGLEFGSPH